MLGCSGESDATGLELKKLESERLELERLNAALEAKAELARYRQPYLEEIATIASRYSGYGLDPPHIRKPDTSSNDLIKINARAHEGVVRACVLYNQNDHGGDEHLDINTVNDVRVEDCILLNDFAACGRPVGNRSHSFVVIKNSGSAAKVTRRITLGRNVFLNYQGKVDQCYVLLGEDGKPFHEAQELLIENNLFLHHSPVRFWGTLLLKGGSKDIVFRANTFVGHPHIKWSGAYAAVCARIGNNAPVGDLGLSNNIWYDTTGEMPRFSVGSADLFALGSEQVLHNNLYWNGDLGGAAGRTCARSRPKAAPGRSEAWRSERGR